MPIFDKINVNLVICFSNSFIKFSSIFSTILTNSSNSSNLSNSSNSFSHFLEAFFSFALSFSFFSSFSFITVLTKYSKILELTQFRPSIIYFSSFLFFSSIDLVIKSFKGELISNLLIIYFLLKMMLFFLE